MDYLEFRTTADGSLTIYNSLVGEHYHSKHGALQESQHVFINTGLKHLLSLQDPTSLNILEVGFGTGFNFLLSADHCMSVGKHLSYTGIELHPLTSELIQQTGYHSYLHHTGLWDNFTKRYNESFRSSVSLNPLITLNIYHGDVSDFSNEELFDIVYFDAFAPVHQPEMWSEEVIMKIGSYIRTGGIFITYSITGNLKRALKKAGFTIEKPPGAKGKREMMRATKI